MSRCEKRKPKDCRRATDAGIEVNIATLLQMAAQACPTRAAVKCGELEFTYQQLWNAAEEAASLFRSSTCSHVAYLGESSPAVPIALFGAALAALPYVPLNYRLSDAELEALLGRITPALLITDRSPAFSFEESTLMQASYLLELGLSASEEAEVPQDPDLVALQLFTSGTTGTPKAALLRHMHLFSYVISSVEFMSADEHEAQLTSVPPYHIAGVSAIMSSVYACRRIVQLPNFDAKNWLELLTKESITSAFVVPTMLSRILDELQEKSSVECPRLASIAYGGGKMPMPVIERALQVFPRVAFTNAYGLTETSSTVALLGPEDHRESAASDDSQIRRRLGSVGKALPSIEIEIRDEAGNCLGPDEAGEIYVRGPQVSGEYRERSTTDEEGWFATRDAGMLDRDGYLYLAGRADDVIVRGGENISPAEIEDVLLQDPRVSDVAVVGIPSTEWGETIAAAVVLKDGLAPDQEHLRKLVRERLRSSKVPEFIRYVAELPYNETGKLLRRVVKQGFE